MTTGTLTTSSLDVPRHERRLSQVTKELVIPKGIIDTEWRTVAPRVRAMGVKYDRWQADAAKLALATDADGLYAATVGGVGMSICRQAGKTYWLAGIVFAKSSLTPNLTTIWTSHHLKTTNETFGKMQAFAKRALIAPYVDRVLTGKGDEAVEFANGSRILFGARERGFGRGMDDVDQLVCDESQILTGRAMDDMIATMNTATNPLAFFLGTPPRPEDPSEAFMRMRSECLDGLVDDTVWIECGASDGCNPNDQAQWAIANPSFPHRTPVTAMKRMMRKLSVDSWMREGLGVYQDKDQKVFDLAKWATLTNRDADQPRRVVLVVAVSPDREWSSIGIAGKGTNGKTLVMCYSMRGTSWVAEKIAELRKARSIWDIWLVGGQAKAVKTDLANATIDFKPMTYSDEGASCGSFQLGVKDRMVEHLGQKELDVAVANAITRKTSVGDVEIWDTAKASVDISPLRACAAAYYLWRIDTVPLGK